MQANITIKLNGEPLEIKAQINLFELLEHLEIEPRNVAIEKNLEIVPRSQWQSCLLQENDRIEIVQFVGGGR